MSDLSHKFNISDEGPMPREVMKILNSYIKPIQRLTAKFPNQELEFQIEFQETYPKSTQPQRRRFILYKQPQNRRLNMEEDPFGPGPDRIPVTNTELSSTPTVITVPSSTVETTETKTTESIEKTEPTPIEPTKTVRKRRVTTTTEALSEENQFEFTKFTKTVRRKRVTEAPSEEENKDERKPVYMDDLKKVLDEFADKIKSTKCPGAHATTDQNPPQIVISNPGPVHGNRNIDEVIELIRKGIQINKHIPMPKDEDLDWMQIKIPA